MIVEVLVVGMFVGVVENAVVAVELVEIVEVYFGAAGALCSAARPVVVALGVGVFAEFDLAYEAKIKICYFPYCLTAVRDLLVSLRESGAFTVREIL